MKRYIIYFLLTCMLLLSGCTHANSKTLSKTNSPKNNKTIITLGVMYDDGLIQPMINSYNEKNDTYYVELKSYEAYEDPCQQFLLDVSSGNAPDIIEVGVNFPAALLMDKNLLLNLDPLFEKDSEIKKTDLLDNVVEALQTNNSLYYVCESVGLNALLAKTSDVGERTGWTENEMLTFLNSKPDDQKLLQLNSNGEILGSLLYNNLDQYVDWSTGQCKFDTQQFKNLLMFAKRGDAVEPDYDVPFPIMLQNGEILFNELKNFGVVETINSISIFNEPVTAIGYPCADSNGFYFQPYHSFGICSQTKNVDGAWDFLRTFISKDFQTEEIVEHAFNYIPTRKDVFERMLKDFQITKSYEDEYGNTIEPYSDTYSYDDYTIEYGPLSDEQIQTFLNIFNRTHKIDTSDTSIINIITDETSAFYKGQKNVDETAKLIQNRVTTYVNESR